MFVFVFYTKHFVSFEKGTFGISLIQENKTKHDCKGSEIVTGKR